MDRNFLCLQYGADKIEIDLSLSALISLFMKSNIGFLNNPNLHAIISTLLIINWQWVKKFILLYYMKYITLWCSSLVSRFNLVQSFRYTPYLFYKKRFKSEINSLCIWTRDNTTFDNLNLINFFQNQNTRVSLESVFDIKQAQPQQ